VTIIDPYSTLEVSRHATDADIERAYERLLKLFDPEWYPGSTEDAHRRLEEVNAAYAQLRGRACGEGVESEPEDSEPVHEGDADGRRAAVADNLVRVGFIPGDARRQSNPAVDVLTTLLPPGAEIAVCLTCLGVKSTGQYECRERSDSFSATTVMRHDGPYATGDYVHAIKRSEIVLCTEGELSWTVSRYAGQRTDRVTLYSIPFHDILGASVRGRKRDVVEVWIADGPTVAVQTRPREADALRECLERAATTR